VFKYNQRVLTFPEDVLAAFDGLTSKISGAFDGGFLWGLPEMFFDVALLWRMSSSERRKPTESSNISRIPSWTWMSLRGYFWDIGWKSGSNYMWDSSETTTQELDTVPILKWYCIDQKNDQKRSISNTWRKYINCRKGGGLPRGWEAHERSLGRLSHFTHESIPNAIFKYPIPIREQPRTDDIKAPGYLIACRTQRAYLVYTYEASTWLKAYSLLTNQRDWIGCLHEDIQGQSSTPGTCELIAISAGQEGNSPANRWWVTNAEL
jgi:hypothetical protein